MKIMWNLKGVLRVHSLQQRQRQPPFAQLLLRQQRPAATAALSTTTRTRQQQQQRPGFWTSTSSGIGVGGSCSTSSITRLSFSSSSHEHAATAATTTSGDKDSETSVNVNVFNLMKESIQRLKDSQIDEPEESVFHLLAHVLGLSWESGFRELRQLYRENRSNNQNHQSISFHQQQQWQSFLDRRLKHEPLQYILGQWDFLDYTLYIRPPLLCPRPETEELVMLGLETIIKQLPQKQNQQPFRILDVGCGTGCIGISLAAELVSKQQQQFQVTALDIDPVAVSVSKENAQRILGKDDDNNNSSYSVHHVAAADFHLHDKKFDFVISNPPYIPPADMNTLDPTVLHYENYAALCGSTTTTMNENKDSNNNDDGLEIIRQIVHQLPKWCKSGAYCWMEVNPTHPALLRKWLNDSTSTSELGVEFVQMALDLQGMERFVQLRVKLQQQP